MATKKSNKSLWIMLALIVVLAVAILLLPASCSTSKIESTTLVKVGQIAPDFTVDDIGLHARQLLAAGRAPRSPEVEQHDLAAQRRERHLVSADHLDRFAGQDFVFMALSRGENRANVEAFRHKTGYTFPMGLDSLQMVYDQYATNYIPRNFVINRNGEVILTSIGYDPQEFDEMISTIEKTLQSPK